jgi:polysaccharide export outer membrane protein
VTKARPQTTQVSGLIALPRLVRDHLLCLPTLEVLFEYGLPQNQLSKTIENVKRQQAVHMRLSTAMAAISLINFGVSVLRAQENTPVQQNSVVDTRPTSLPSLPSQPLGIDDLISVSVYGAPELSRTIRVDGDGMIRIPLLKERIKAAGSTSKELEIAITEELKKEQILVDPEVSVSVTEYRSRPISVVGAVRRPTTFQATNHNTRVLDAISHAEGFAEDAGPDILVTHPSNLSNGSSPAMSQRISIKELISGGNEALNITLQGGDEVRVPTTEKIYVVGNVKRPGAFPIHDDGITVLKALSLSEGLQPYTASTAYIYRREASGGNKNEIPVDLGKIIERKASDVPLVANDILYIPDRPGRRSTMSALEKVLIFGSGMAAAGIYAASR